MEWKTEEDHLMSTIKVLGVDLGKFCFHAIGIDHSGASVLRKKFTRTKLISALAQLPPCTVAFEACGGAHILARTCQSLGHNTLLIPPQYVKPYVKGNKTDYIDAAAIAEACERPSMRFVPVKSESSQVMAVCHRLREAYVAERTACMSRIGAFLLEFGLSLPKGHAAMKRLFSWIGAQKGVTLPVGLLTELNEAYEHYLYLNERIAVQDRKIRQHVDQDDRCQLLKSIPGVGDMVASQTGMEVGNGHAFKGGREMAAWMGLVPRQYSTGGKPRLLGISKRGNKHLRCLFVHGARSVLSRLEHGEGPFHNWLRQLRANKPFNVVVVALANKLALIAWAVLHTMQPFDAKRI
jgi:transposase